MSDECFTRDFDADFDFRDLDADFRDLDADFDFRDLDADFRDTPTDLHPFPTIHSQSADSKHSCFRLEEQFVIYLLQKKINEK